MNIRLNRIAKDTDIFLKKFLNNQNNSQLIPAMKYGLFPGGKKIRSKILIDIGSLLSIDYKTLINLGGFANITKMSTNNIIAYDICPVNIIFNHFAHQILTIYRTISYSRINTCTIVSYFLCRNKPGHDHL